MNKTIIYGILIIILIICIYHMVNGCGCDGFQVGIERRHHGKNHGKHRGRHRRRLNLEKEIEELKKDIYLLGGGDGLADLPIAPSGGECAENGMLTRSCPKGECCSKWGYCGSSPSHCNKESLDGQRCIDDKDCQSDQCCSQWNYCGSSEDYCSSGPGPVPNKCDNKKYWKGKCKDNEFTLVNNVNNLDLKDKIYVYNNLDIEVMAMLLKKGNETKREKIPSKGKVVFKFPKDAKKGYRLNIQHGKKILSFVEFSDAGVNMSYVDSFSYPVRIHNCCNKKRGCCFDSIEKYNEFNKECCLFGSNNVNTTLEKTGCLSQRDFCLTKKRDPQWKKFCGDNSHLKPKDVGSVCGGRSKKASDIWGCNPNERYSGLDDEPSSEGFINAQCCAALNRGVKYTDAGPYDEKGNDTHAIKPSDKFYTREDKKYNQYSKMVHNICPNIFGFPHDDINRDGGYLGWSECIGKACGKRGGFAVQIG